MDQTLDTIERQAFAKELGELADKWPDLTFEDRANTKFLGTKWRNKRGEMMDISILRFQAWRPAIEHVKLAAIPGVRFAMNQMVAVRRLIAWASTPKRLGQILREKGVLP